LNNGKENKLARAVAAARRFCGSARDVFAKFAYDRGNMLAAAVSFYALLSLAPLFLLAVGVFAHLLGSPERAYALLVDYIGKFSPAFVHEQETGIRTLMTQLIRGKDVAWGVGAIGLAWAATQIFVSLEIAMNAVWKVTERRNFIKQRLVAFGMMLIIGLLFAVTIGVSALAHLAQNIRLPVLGLEAADLPFAWHFLTASLPPILAFLMFLAIYQVLPSANVPFRPASAGAATSAILWEVARRLFGLYVIHFANFNKVYGPVTTMIVLALWIYYSAVVSVLGAEVAIIYQEKSSSSP